MKIIFAQGNPEPDYANTRHNIGFTVLNELSEQLKLKWNGSSKFHAQIAEASISGEKVLLVKPTTFYNDTGASIRKIVDFYKLDPSHELLVIHDDLALAFGVIRIRSEGSDAVSDDQHSGCSQSFSSSVGGRSGDGSDHVHLGTLQ
jgi:PTH1 family peptidyl-tRNA hydrolase